VGNHQNQFVVCLSIPLSPYCSDRVGAGSKFRP
jgi:hypothetical protein